MFSQWGRWVKTSPNFLQPLLENIDRRSCNDARRELIPAFHNPHRKCRLSPSAVARTLEYLEGVPSQAASSGRKEEQVRINIQNPQFNLPSGNGFFFGVRSDCVFKQIIVPTHAAVPGHLNLY